MNINFQQEENDILRSFLNKIVDFPTFSEIVEKRNKEKQNLIKAIELIIKPECNQKCEYCYITRHGKELYPLEERVDNNTILKNLDILLNYYLIKKEFFIKNWELFAGDLFYDNLFFEIIDVFEKYIKILIKKYPTAFKDNVMSILMPCNASFTKDKEKIEKVINIVERFKYEYNVRISFSFSTDGKFVTDTRENQYDDKFYDNLFNISNKLNYRFHPMISSSNVKNWIKNYDWWLEMFKKHYKDDSFEKEFQPMILEVRNNDWTDESLKAYKELLEYMFFKRLELCDNNVDKLAYHLLCGDGKNDTIKAIEYNDPIKLLDFNNSLWNKMSCSIQNNFHITLNNLSFIPCHRLAYPQFVGGKFIVENNEIKDVEAKNVTLFINNYMTNTNLQPKCISCIYRDFCMKGCLGAQYETTGELYEPSINVCRMLKVKYRTLFNLYQEYNIFNRAKQQNLLSKEFQEKIEFVLKHMGKRTEYEN